MTERSPASTRIAALAGALALIACAWSAPTQAADISVVGLMPKALFALVSDMHLYQRENANPAVLT